MIKMAGVLKKHIIGHSLYTNISGKNYAHVEGWQFAGFLVGMYPIVESVEDLSKTGEVKWRATVEIRKGTDVIGRGVAICSNKENRKKNFDEYAILSMAQTRAIGKAYRNMLGWVMKLAGYEGTPAEEMKKVGESVEPPIKASVTITPASAAKTPEQILCKECGKPISFPEADFSMKIYKRPLCREHQPKKK